MTHAMTLASFLSTLFVKIVILKNPHATSDHNLLKSMKSVL